MKRFLLGLLTTVLGMTLAIVLVIIPMTFIEEYYGFFWCMSYGFVLIVLLVALEALVGDPLE